MAWAKLEDNVLKVIVNLKYYKNKDEAVEHVFDTQEGYMFYRDCIRNKNIWFGSLTEVYTKETINIASFCHG